MRFFSQALESRMVHRLICSSREKGSFSGMECWDSSRDISRVLLARLARRWASSAMIWRYWLRSSSVSPGS